METTHYLKQFQEVLHQLDHQLFAQKQLDLKVGIWLNSAVLKIQNQAWLNPSATAKPFAESIFFSVWVNGETIGKNRLYYNIHALKLRELTGYKIQSREFAVAFRARFKPFELQWPHVRTDFGPLTLMEGWVKLDEIDFDETVKALVLKFLDMAFIVDELLAERKK